MTSFEDNLKRIKDGTWIKSNFITSGKYFSLVDCSDELKVSFKCMLCMPLNNVLTAYVRSSGNLRSHIQVRMVILC